VGGATRTHNSAQVPTREHWRGWSQGNRRTDGRAKLDFKLTIKMAKRLGPMQLVPWPHFPTSPYQTEPSKTKRSQGRFVS